MGDPYRELNAQLHGWLTSYTGDVPFERARKDCPGEWIAVHDLRPLEVIAFLLLIPFRPHRPVMGLMWDAENELYLCYPFEKLPQKAQATLRTGPWAVWRSVFVTQTPTLQWCWRGIRNGATYDSWATIENWFARTSERLDAWFRGVEPREEAGDDRA